MSLEDFVREVRKIDPELAFEYACTPDLDEYVIAYVDRNAGTCRLSRHIGEEPGEPVSLERVHFKEWRNGPKHVGRKPGIPGDIVTLAD